jgi:shikimate dehydrogenase
MNRLAVLGQPIAHSLSPRMHSAAFAALGLADEWSYEAIELSPEGFAAGVADLRERGYVGANVTVPHKRAALELADEASEAARAIGAANTLSFGPGGVAADNTDAPGLIASLPGPVEGSRVLVLGAGGAARAAVWALLGAGAAVDVRNRTSARAEELVAEIGGTAVPAAGPIELSAYDVVVNATSVGLAKPGADVRETGSDLKKLGIEADGLDEHLILVDMVYGTRATELVAAGSRGGARVVDGLEILIRQGSLSFRIWTGLEPPLQAMREAILENER